MSCWPRSSADGRRGSKVFPGSHIPALALYGRSAWFIFCDAGFRVGPCTQSVPIDLSRRIGRAVACVGRAMPSSEALEIRPCRGRGASRAGPPRRLCLGSEHRHCSDQGLAAPRNDIEADSAGAPAILSDDCGQKRPDRPFVLANDRPHYHEHRYSSGVRICACFVPGDWPVTRPFKTRFCCCLSSGVVLYWNRLALRLRR